MKKILTIILALVLTASVFALAACNFDFDSTWDFKADNYDDAIALFEEFFADTIKQTNVTSTVNDGEDDCTYYVDGDKAYSISGNFKHYSYVQDGEYYYGWVLEDEDSVSGMIMKGKDLYDDNYPGFTFYFTPYYMLEETATFNCEVKGSSKKENGAETTEATLKLTATLGQENLVVNAKAVNGLVTEYDYAYSYFDEDEQDTVTVTINQTLEYGSAHIDIPDLSEYLVE